MVKIDSNPSFLKLENDNNFPDTNSNPSKNNVNKPEDLPMFNHFN